MPLSTQQVQNFTSLQRAFLAGDVVLLECQLVATGEVVAVVSALNRQPNGDTEFVPFALLFPDNPYAVLNPPNPDGGFYVPNAAGSDHTDATSSQD